MKGNKSSIKQFHSLIDLKCTYQNKNVYVVFSIYLDSRLNFVSKKLTLYPLAYIQTRKQKTKLMFSYKLWHNPFSRKLAQMLIMATKIILMITWVLILCLPSSEL